MSDKDIDALNFKRIAVKIERSYLEATLPYPPSANTAWRASKSFYKNKIYLNPKVVKFRKRVQEILMLERFPKMSGPIFLELYLYMPDKRRRDIDNPIKAVLDALEHGGLFENDSQVSKLLVQKMGIEKNGKAIVKISKISCV